MHASASSRGRPRLVPPGGLEPMAGVFISPETRFQEDDGSGVPCSVRSERVATSTGYMKSDEIQMATSMEPVTPDGLGIRGSG